MTEQPQVNLEHVISILRIRLNEEIYHRALLEAAYQQQTQELNQLREQAANNPQTAATPTDTPPKPPDTK